MLCCLLSWNNHDSIIFSFLFFTLFEVGNHIDVLSGKWTAQDAGIGAGVDSYFEYLLKGGILFSLPILVDMFKGKPG